MPSAYLSRVTAPARQASCKNSLYRVARRTDAESDRGRTRPQLGAKGSSLFRVTKQGLTPRFGQHTGFKRKTLDSVDWVRPRLKWHARSAVVVMVANAPRAPAAVGLPGGLPAFGLARSKMSQGEACGEDGSRRVETEHPHHNSSMVRTPEACQVRQCASAPTVLKSRDRGRFWRRHRQKTLRRGASWSASTSIPKSWEHVPLAARAEDGSKQKRSHFFATALDRSSAALRRPFGARDSRCNCSPTYFSKAGHTIKRVSDVPRYRRLSLKKGPYLSEPYAALYLLYLSSNEWSSIAGGLLLV